MYKILRELLTNIGKIACQLELIHDPAANSGVALHSETEHTAKGVGTQQLFCTLMRGVRRQAKIGGP